MSRATSIPPPTPSTSSNLNGTGQLIQGSRPSHPRNSFTTQSQPPQPQKSVLPKPNYHISLSDVFANTNQQPPLTASPMTPSNQLNQSHPPISSMFSAPAVTPPPAFASRPAMGDILTPLKPQQPSFSGNTNKLTSKDIWNDFDPLA